MLFDYTHHFLFFYTHTHVFTPVKKWDTIYIELDVSRHKSLIYKYSNGQFYSEGLSEKHYEIKSGSQ